MNTIFYFFVAGTVITLIWVIFLFFYWEIPKVVSEFRAFGQMLKEKEAVSTKKIKKENRTVCTVPPKEKESQTHEFPLQPASSKESDETLFDNSGPPPFQINEETAGTVFLTPVNTRDVREFRLNTDNSMLTEFLSEDKVMDKGKQYLEDESNHQNTEVLSEELNVGSSTTTEYLQQKSHDVVTELLEVEKEKAPDTTIVKSTQGYTQILTEMIEIEMEGTKTGTVTLKEPKPCSGSVLKTGTNERTEEGTEKT